MRCECCDRNLNDYESVAKHAVTGKYLNMCRTCLREIGIIPVISNPTFDPFEKMIEDDSSTGDNYGV
jgi:hypothetical protein